MAGDTSEVCGTVKWTIMGTSSDGSKVEIEVTATLNKDGSITVNYGLADGSAEADIIGVYFDFFNDGGKVDKLDGGNNMKGYGDGFDVGFEEGKAGLKDGANTDGSMTFTADQLKAFGFVDPKGNALTGDDLMKAFAETEIGVRATSTGEDGEGSLKIGAVGEYCPPDEKDDFFPKWDQDVSNIILVFDQTEGDQGYTVPKPGGPAEKFDGDGYYTVKIDGWDGSNDIDDQIDDILAWLIENDPNITEDSVLLGVIIKGGTQDTEFYAYGDNDTNGTDPDDAPDGLALTWEGSSNPAPANAVDESYEYEDVFAAA